MSKKTPQLTPDAAGENEPERIAYAIHALLRNKSHNGAKFSELTPEGQLEFLQATSDDYLISDVGHLVEDYFKATRKIVSETNKTRIGHKGEVYPGTIVVGADPVKILEESIHFSKPDSLEYLKDMLRYFSVVSRSTKYRFPPSEPKRRIPMR